MDFHLNFFQKRGIFMPNVSSPWALIRIIPQCRNLRHGYRSTKLRIDIVDNVEVRACANSCVVVIL